MRILNARTNLHPLLCALCSRSFVFCRPLLAIISSLISEIKDLEHSDENFKDLERSDENGKYYNKYKYDRSLLLDHDTTQTTLDAIVLLLMGAKFRHECK